MRDLKWQGCGTPIDEGMIRTIEERLGVRLPADYVECVKHCDGGQPTIKYFEYPDPSLGLVETLIGNLFSLDTTRENNLLDVVDQLSDQLPSGVVPFAGEPGGDVICFDYRNSATPTVVYWMHEQNIEESIAPLAPSFSAFLDRLHDRR